MASRGAVPGFERYRLTIKTHGNHTLQPGRDSTSDISTWQTWRRGRSLGQGGFGEVHQQVWEDEHQDLHYRAVKVCVESKVQIDYERELSTLAAFSNSEYSGFFVNLHGWWIASGNVFIAMEYLRYGDLSRYAGTSISEVETKEITKNVLRGLEIMHDHGFTHRDIKPQNVLVVHKRPEFPQWWVKIADFGISKQVLEGSDTALHTTVGTKGYCAPEVLGLLEDYETSIYSSKVDIWSLGCVIFNIGSRGEVPFAGPELLKYCNGRGTWNPRNHSLFLDSDGVSFLAALLQAQPDQRPTATQALRYPWLATVDTNASDARSGLRSNPYPMHQQNFNSFMSSTRSTNLSANNDHIDLTIRPAGDGSRWDAPAVPEIHAITTINTRHSNTNHASQQFYSSQSISVDATEPTRTQEPSGSSYLPRTMLSGQAHEDPIPRQSGFGASVSRPEPSATSGTATEELQSPRAKLSQWTEENKDKIRKLAKIGCEPLYLAAEQGQLEIATYLVEDGANINTSDKKGRTPLHVAARAGHLPIVKGLIQQGANIHARDDSGLTAIFHASSKGHLHVMQWLKEQGADILAKVDFDWNPLHAAVFMGHLQVVKWLVKEGTNVNAKSVDGWTALMQAVDNNRLEIGDYLVKQGADIHARNDHGWNLLHVAANEGQLESAKWALLKGANVRARSNSGSTPLDIAEREKYTEMANWLREKEKPPKREAREQTLRQDEKREVSTQRREPRKKWGSIFLPRR